MPSPDSPHLESSHLPPTPHHSPSQSPIKIKIMPVVTRNAAKSDSVGPSGSEYNASEPSSAAPDLRHDDSSAEEPEVYTRSQRGRRVKQVVYEESEYEEEDEIDGLSKPNANQLFDDGVKVRRLRVREVVEGDEGNPQPSHRLRRTRNLQGFITDDEDEKIDDTTGYSLRSRSRSKAAPPKKNGSVPPTKQTRENRYKARLQRRERKDEDDQYIAHSDPSSADADGSVDLNEDAMGTSDLEVTHEPEPEPETEVDEDNDGKPYSLRQRQKINYAIPPPLEEMPRPQPKPTINRNGGRGGPGKGRRGPGWSATGAELGRWMGMGGDDSDSDHPTRTPRKQPFGMDPFGAGVPAGGMLPGDLAAGTPSNLGRMGEGALADADPLGVNQNVTFGEVGGLDEHIHSLKEMTLLPLLYPEVFQRFGVTPPRGVLFHGPPGTGKTLLARALAASCRSNGRSISFFMRKGADCLSKWVGEAERQLRLLFEEAKNSQPSIIFFDEIDGLAPVRSSKQDQIHASIVSTLLALMDGMDGRGQVVVIGATNRPDAVDPALRRPGRFDREFYFPLPGLDAREKILSIMTKGWMGWNRDDGDEQTKERLTGLAKLTKGYGGADLRALCTEAALNAVQRRYPQIYKSNERLLLNAETINVQLRDFMISIKKLVPSSARSSSSAASPLPQQFVPLLGDTLEKVKSAIDKVLPLEKKLSALEEAEFEDEGGEDGALDREMFSQSMQTLRVYRPRILIHGSGGMGQNYVGAAALHHLEGYHVQTLELGTLLGDSTRSTEAAIVQLFVEAKRHQPSIIYIPSLLSWCAAISETSRSTVRAMLDTLSPTEPVLLLALIDGKFSHLPHDVKQWFGHMRENRVLIAQPTEAQREEFFLPLVNDIRRPPNQFPDGVKRRKRVLEELAVAPPLEPRKPSPAELALQIENDQKTITLLKYRLGPILTELKRKFKRFTKRASEEYSFDFSEPRGQVEAPAPVEATTIPVPDVEVPPQVNGIIEVVDQEQAQVQVAINPMDVDLPPPSLPPPPPPAPRLYDVDLEKMHVDMYRGRYLTPEDFLEDIVKIVRNTEIRAYEDMDRMYKAKAMLTAAEVSIQDFDPVLRSECERMAGRERQRREEHRRNRAKVKEREREKEREENVNRRSTRSSGQVLDISITDPVKLERRLKRQRGGSAGSSQHDEEDGAGVNGDMGERESKRSRLSAEEDEERDPLDIISQNTPVHARTVHFAPSTEGVDPNLSRPAQDLLGDGAAAMEIIAEQNFGVQGTPRSRGGFDPALLNPLPPMTDVFSAAKTSGTASPASNQSATTSSTTQNPDILMSHSTPSKDFNFTTTAPTPTMNVDENPFLAPPNPAQLQVRTPSPRPRTPVPIRRTRTPEAISVRASPQSPPAPQPMVVERTPTPPLPDFHVDEVLITELHRQLKMNTASLNVEQLEQLRATCLGNVWRHRTEWDRDNLVRELMDLVKEFVEEVGEFEELEGQDTFAVS
ncbi:hypothetical protein AGABI1DRAFT_132600 [Agaricus bisporus var. burnettii JB137-S8]|uniref:AAA+ ATPase domain-containing protein n=1 Tax=Agaricus bisporus var. burnettii (strain JB137-S8 / ATCC MYA-4627 / FGSC 10392) TaxID=597362 RepID=K5WWY1_AGABU|nr:uncharacterized protein AGABI1DRAFT_132600 [Agaricus bisporus var. burnettii JB137-S8]EKM75062.1 hypothetical protein AGABI1DRAFT_132600 [Agaricus bisporus var. burnettii JB137-S8]